MTEILREAAKGRDCQVRSEYCNHNPETTVLAHWNGAGMGLKHHDLLGAWACSDCHNYVDNKTHKLDPWLFKTAAHFQGIIRTLLVLIDEGYIQIVKPKAPKISKY